MQGDFTRWTFAPQQGYRSVLLQQGRVLLDADWNEQAEITAHHDEVRTRDVVGADGGPDDGAGFGIIDARGATPSNTPWADLRLTPGRYYVEGVLVEASEPQVSHSRDGGEAKVGWPLADQPHLRALDGGPGLAEPQDDGRYAVLLEAWTHHVTADEQPALREPALGGPDTTTRAQTVWQVRLERLDETTGCADLRERPTVPQGTMAASLKEAAADPDPCRIIASGGYQRLENQLYRVQIHDTSQEKPTFLWSRENGSVVAGLSGLTPLAEAGTAELALDREGRDEELSIREGETVEITSTDLQLHGRPGFLATAGAPRGLLLTVRWIGAAPSSLASLGRAPVVRRWEGPARPISQGRQDLEGGIQVRFSDDGAFSTGDYWLIPARAVRLVYGLTTLAGTIDWPPGSAGTGEPRPPTGPLRRTAPLAVLKRTAGGWSRETDCRRLFPGMTELIALDLVGGDGQEALPGTELAAPVRVAVRNGALSVTGALVRFTSQDAGTLRDGARSGATLDVATDSDGIAQVHWTLAPDGATTQTVVAQLLDDQLHGVGVTVAVTGRLSVAAQVAWTPTCPDFAGTGTVQAALDRMATRSELLLLGGDGQHLRPPQRVLPQPVRVMVDSPCGPVAEATVTARTVGSRALVADVGPGGQPPDDLHGSGGGSVEVVTGDDGAAAFWWQPDFGGSGSDVLQVSLSGDARRVPVTVTAQPLGTPGLHICRVSFLLDGKDFANDDDVDVSKLASGIQVDLDGPVARACFESDPVTSVRVLLDLPWPTSQEAQLWSNTPVGFQAIGLEGDVTLAGDGFSWAPTPKTQAWLTMTLPAVLTELKLSKPLVGRLVIDGWAIMSAQGDQDGRRLYLNGHATAFLDGNRVRLRLPTDDAVAGGPFVQWFRLTHQQ